MALKYNELVQQKIYQLLSADSEITSTYEAGIYDQVPDNTEGCYVVIGEDTFDDNSSHTHNGFKVEISLHTFTDVNKGKKRCKQIQGRIYELLHNIDLGLTGQNTVNMRSGLQETLLDPDGRTYHGINKFNLILGG